jgi:hypothetical protein
MAGRDYRDQEHLKLPGRMVTIDRDLTAVHAQEAAAAFAEAVARLPSHRACRNSRHSWWKGAGCRSRSRQRPRRGREHFV